MEMIVSGVSSSSKYFVAINEAPQNIIAKSGSQYLYDFVLMILMSLKHLSECVSHFERREKSF
jgi:hypothetical protein